MATLTEAAIFSKKTFVWLLAAGAVFVLIFALFLVGKSLMKIISPPKPPPATVAFGKISELDLSEGIRASANITYSIETISGDLPILVDKAKVFKIAETESSFGDLERAGALALRHGFADYTNLGSNVFQFRDAKDEKRVLIYNIASGNFKLDNDFVNDPEMATSNFSSVEQAIKIARDFMLTLGLDEVEFPKERSETKYLRLDGNNLVEVPALTQANLIKVNFNRRELDKMRVISPRDDKAAVWAVVSSKGVVAAQKEILPIEKNRFATYPLKGTAKAFEKLKAGNGAFNKQFNGNSFAIRNVEMAYLETKGGQGFLQPVYVFKGDEGFVSYTGALDENWVISNQTPPVPPLP